ncbi:AMP-binding protein [Staphylococcus equorum]|uniref:Putative long chain fatty acid-CoA ligase VraA n=1 Tax=Staphylococcus equorum TaxID=246432 RepID=A0A9X4L5F0_9STAP|nr:AMP-binding protein [Staphylococcus equorum]MDG0820263.1 AMP-binding protein [Staphylococcus equorum]MDG0846588.1 AMP-binding protein [Staphylococcus equorum]
MKVEILEKIDQHAQERPQHLALQFDDLKCNYKQLKINIELVLEDIASIPSHQFVAVIMKDPMETIIYYCALLKKNCIPCILDFQWSQAQIDTLLNHYGISYVINEEQEIISKHIKNNQLKWHDDLLHVGFTSGTTGLPKAYYRNEKSWLYSYKENEKLLGTLINILVAPGPLSHSLSLYTCIYALYSGRTFIGQRQFDAPLLLQTIEKVSETVAMFLVPTMLTSCLAENIKMESVRYIFSTGDKLPLEIRNKVQQYMPQTILIEFFGTSEASFISYNYNNEAPYHSVGLPFPNVKIHLAHQDEQGVGVLHIQSNMVFSGYANQDISRSKWLEIGDFASLDHNGYLYLHGRQSDRMIIGGRNVYPTEIERVAQEYEYFNEVCIVSEPHSKFGEIAVLLYTGTRYVSYQSLKSFLSSYLGRYQIPSKLIKIDEMYYTQSGKIARRQMKERYLGGEFK